MSIFACTRTSPMAWVITVAYTLDWNQVLQRSKIIERDLNEISRIPHIFLQYRLKKTQKQSSHHPKAGSGDPFDSVGRYWTSWPQPHCFRHDDAKDDCWKLASLEPRSRQLVEHHSLHAPDPTSLQLCRHPRMWWRQTIEMVGGQIRLWSGKKTLGHWTLWKMAKQLSHFHTLIHANGVLLGTT